MSTASKKKTKVNIRSTDRGGSVLLPLGVAVIIFSWMLLLGATLQTSSGALTMFKNLAIGLGGGLYLVLPIMLMWLGVLLVMSSKRYVSFYAFSMAFLLVLCVGALMNLTLAVNDRTYPRLMDYIKNSNAMRQTPYADSLGEYLRSSFKLHNILSMGRGLYPGGGALSMLLAHPLYSILGNTTGIVVLVLAIIALIFALLRVSPAQLYNNLSDKFNRIPAHQPAAAQTAQVYEQQPEYQAEPAQTAAQPQPAWPAQAANDYQTQPIDPYEPVNQGQYTQAPVYQEVEPGFVAQTQDSFFDEFAAAPAQPQKPNPVWPKQSATDRPVSGRQAAWPQAQERPSQPDPWGLPLKEKEEKPAVEQTYHEPVHQDTWQPVEAAAPVQEPLEETRPTRRRASRNEEELEPVVQVQQTPQVPQEPEIPAFVEPEPEPFEPVKVPILDDIIARNNTPKPVHTAPAVELTGERVPIKKREESFGYASLDGMVKKPEPKQIKLALDDYQSPPLRLLAENTEEHNDTTQEDRIRADKLIETLKSFQINASLHDIVHGPTVTRFAIRLAEGVNVSKLRNVMDNLTIELRAKGDIRAEMPIPGTSFVGLEVSNDKTSKVYLRDVLESPKMKENKSPTTVALGKDITGTPITCELMDMPHLLIAGATGSGKSVCINSIICSILYRASPRNVRLIMVDPKFVELQPYNNVPHLWCPVITDAQKATKALEWVCQEMDNRYQIMVDAGVRNLDAYNKKLGPDEEPLPRIIVIVDEMADLMTTSGKMIEDHIKRITAKARAAGICLILATQRPSVNIITGVIKANIPGRIAFRVSSPFDSKTILDSQGAEKLLGYGDMLYRSMTRDPIRVQGCFVTDHDVEQTVEYIRSRNKAEYNLDLTEHMEKEDQPEGANGMADGEGGDAEFDELLPQAIEMAVEAGQMSISMLQRVLRVGYARSGRLIDEMTRRGIISGNEGTKPRRTLMTREQYMNYLENGN